jgi:hypothetical protein
MLLYASAHKADVSTQYRLYRWSIRASRYLIEWGDQVQDEHGAWRNNRTYRALAVTKHPDLGLRLIWYYGSHCCLSLGWVHFSWGSGSCEKALSGKYDETFVTRFFSWLRR